MRLLTGFRVGAFLLLVVAFAPAGPWAGTHGQEKARARPAKKLDDNAARRLLEDYWVEVKVIRAGKELGATDLRGWSFVRHDSGLWFLSAEIGEGDKGGVSCWPDTGHDPMWLDVSVADTAQGIFKFDGDTLVWATRGDFPENPFTTRETRRPDTFESTRENGWTVRYLKRTDAFWGQKLK